MLKTQNLTFGPVINTCPICLENITRIKKLKCNHSFCEPCIQLWLKTLNTCPICRTTIEREENDLELFIPGWILIDLYPYPCSNRSSDYRTNPRMLSRISAVSTVPDLLSNEFTSGSNRRVISSSGISTSTSLFQYQIEREHHIGLGEISPSSSFDRVSQILSNQHCDPDFYCLNLDPPLEIYIPESVRKKHQ